jgi:isoleucyl-tRNA synthetase
MEAARILVSLGRAAREEAKIRVRQPLRTVEAVLPGGRSLSDEVLEVVREELNVKDVDFLSSAEGIVTLTARPNFRALGPRFGKRTNDAAEAIRGLPQEALSRFLSGAQVSFELDGEQHELGAEELEVAQEASTGLLVKAEGAYAVALDPELDEELLAEGVARELVNRIQRLRKDAGLDITDRIELSIAGPEAIVSAAKEHEGFIGGETLALAVSVGNGEGGGDYAHVREVDIDGTPATIGLRRAEA